MADEVIKSDEGQSYKGRLYPPHSGDFEVVSLRVEQRSLIATTGEAVKTYDLAEFKLELTGQEGDKIRLSHIPSGDAILCTDKAILTDLKQHAGQWDIGREASKASTDLHHLPTKKFVFLWGTIGLTLAVIAGFYLSFDVWVELAMKNIPPSAEETIGSIYVKEEKLDHKSETWKRVNNIGQKLASKVKNSPYKFRFYIENKDELNAYALPGGTIVVLSKLVKDAKSDDEIAGVIGHEIGHVVHRDTLRRLLHTGGLGLCLAIASGGIISADQIQQFIPMLQTLESLNYSRLQESNADKCGIRLTTLSEYDNEAIIGLFERFEKEEPQSKLGKQAFAILSDHPMSADRIAMIRTEAARIRDLHKQGKDAEIEKDVHH